MTQEELEKAVVGKNIHEDIQFEVILDCGCSECAFNCIVKDVDEDADGPIITTAMVMGTFEVDDDGIITSVGELSAYDYCDMDEDGFTFEDAEEICPDGDFMWDWVWDAFAKKCGIEVGEN